jgi:hypothetical protein
MPEMQSTTPPDRVPLAAADAVRCPDSSADYALGCECANPALQIERWQQETAAPATAGAAH